MENGNNETGTKGLTRRGALPRVSLDQSTSFRTSEDREDAVLCVQSIKMMIKVGLLLLASLPLSQPLDDSYLIATLEWVRSHGGFFSDKLEFGAKDGITGILAKEPIQGGETLIVTPRELIIYDDDESYTEDDPCYSPLIAELRKGEDSFFAPYLRRYLSDDEYNAKLLPATWSEEGKNLFGLVFGHGKFPPRHAFTHLFRGWESCQKKDDAIQRLAISLHETHCEGHVVTGDCLYIPLEDTITNHCRGNLPCLDLQMDDKQSFLVVASRDVKAGEMLCHDYYEGNFQFGTPELLRDYGFVESLPQRWTFHKYGIGFDIDETERVVWHENAEVTRASINLLREDLQYLKHDVRLKFESAPETIPANEMDTILQYYEALVGALEKAIAASGFREEERADKNSVEDEL